MSRIFMRRGLGYVTFAVVIALSATVLAQGRGRGGGGGGDGRGGGGGGQRGSGRVETRSAPSVDRGSQPRSNLETRSAVPSASRGSASPARREVTIGDNVRNRSHDHDGDHHDGHHDHDHFSF